MSGTALDLSTSDGTTGSYVVDGEDNMVAVVADAGTELYTATYDPYGTGGNSSVSVQIHEVRDVADMRAGE